MQRFDAAGAELVPGRAVSVQVTGHEPWGVTVVIPGYEEIGASIDAVAIDSPSGSLRALPDEYPGVGSEIGAVVQEVRRHFSPPWVRLTMRAEDLECFRRPCDFCGTHIVLGPGGDGVVMDVRSAEDLGGTTVVSHRECLTARLHPGSLEPPRIARSRSSRDNR